ncbi:general stress protein [Desulfotruncus alcoholivorax]|uniref:general stress protein n=1 Tax=Desulfotruncus alcoholivorax TaxID=265477 RepID=UPI00041A0C85|nr:general stress protein [Desulfotruncus alcoholivorax]
MKTVISTFSNRDQAERAVGELRQKGFDKDISILARDEENRQKNQYTTMENDNISDGTATGGILGGLAGLAVGAGALAIPGIGPLIAAGPIAGLLSGAATGGIAGGLVDYGIPQDRSKYYEDKVKQGRILASVKTDDGRINDAADTLRRHGAQDVEVH